MRQFFQYLHDKLVVKNETSGQRDNGKREAWEMRRAEAISASGRLKISADLFGMTTTAKDDMGIGQLLENALPYFDFVMPMVYPSHYPATFIGFTEPEAHPYEVVHYALQSAVARAEKASTTANEIRPWLQDFGLKMDYGPTEVKAQIKAANDAGLSSWLLWSASNQYTKGALEEN